MLVRPATEVDRPAVDAFLQNHGSASVARLGELVDAQDHPALVANADGRLTGVLTFVVMGDRCEVLTLHATERGQGVGSALLDEVARVATAAGCRLLWLVTTNDNVDAIRFYQRRGFRLAELRPGAVDESRRTLKPGSPRSASTGSLSATSSSCNGTSDEESACAIAQALSVPASTVRLSTGTDRLARRGVWLASAGAATASA